MSLGGGMSLPRGGGGPSLGLKSNNNDTYYNKSIESQDLHTETNNIAVWLKLQLCIIVPKNCTSEGSKLHAQCTVLGCS